MVRLEEFLDTGHMKVVRSSALLTGRLYPQGRLFLLEGGSTPGHSAAGSVKSMKYPNDPMGFEPATFRFVAQYLNQLRHRVSC